MAYVLGELNRENEALNHFNQAIILKPEVPEGYI